MGKKSKVKLRYSSPRDITHNCNLTLNHSFVADMRLTRRVESLRRPAALYHRFMVVFIFPTLLKSTFFVKKIKIK